ncbi:Glycerol-3-phosphate dehydrogenase [Diplonema papillatum]|nr:Glycerol-3-phosphate dehydrogenase [Diplonema papillatum]KAJ9469247.1 Glycerol-3-phosphate dehydrogenase [Diplonema papillatum]
MPQTAKNACVLGGGAFGTAMALHLARKETDVVMWVMEDEVRSAINDTHENKAFLPGFKIPKRVRATNSVAEAVENAEILLLVIPTPFIRKWLHQHHHALPVGVPIVCCSKGVETGTLATPYEILHEEMPGKFHQFL